ncbi:hypothetical protein ACLESO_21620 [Pyxidicoccus sp. 3LG]
MPFDIARVPEPLLVDVDGDQYEILAYTGTDDGTESFFHALGYLLTEYGRFHGDAQTLRRLIAAAAVKLFEGGARELIRKEVYRRYDSEALPYFEALAAGELPGDLVCIWALEAHFNIRVKLLVMTPTALLPLTTEHFCAQPVDTMKVALRGDFHYRPLNYPDLPALEAENYCLTCGVGVPNPLESICDNCVRRPRFCVSCGIAYVDTTSTCVHCLTRLNTLLQEDRERFVAKQVESYVLSCGVEVPPPSKPKPVVEEQARPKFVVYLSNAPFDDFRSGDGTYINALVNWLNAQRTLTHRGLTYDVASYRVCDAGLATKIPVEERGVARIEIDYIRGWPTLKSETERMTGLDWQRFYQPARVQFFRMLAELRAKDKHPQSRHIFHAQVRYPDSGALFDLAFFDALARQGFEVVVTVHEMKFNLLNAENMQRNVVQLNDFVARSDRTIFLNEHDLMCGVKLASAGSLSAYTEQRAQRKFAKFKKAQAEWQGANDEKGQPSMGGPVPPPWLVELGERTKRLEALLKELRNGGTSTVHPTGRAVDAISVPPKRTASFFHIPGIATVKGVEFNAEAILRRPANVLVFGLIKQVDAMQQTAEVARAILSNPEMGNAKVFVVGKVFKDFKHNAISALVGEMCGLSGSNTTKLCKALDALGDKTKTDKDFYAAMSEEIAKRVRACDEAWQAFVRDTWAFVPQLRARLGKVRDQDVSSLNNDPIHAIIVDAQQRLRGVIGDLLDVPYGRNEVVLKSFRERLEGLLPRLIEVVEPLDKAVYPKKELVNGAGGYQDEVVLLKTAITKTKKALAQMPAPAKWPCALLPIEIEFDAPPELFQRIASGCKYAFKVDQKSMADNASSIISLMSNGCITFTESRYDTPAEFYKDHGGVLSPVIMPAQKYGTCDGAFVVREIIRRESERGAVSNRQTLKNMQTLLTKRYGLEAVASKHLAIYKTFLK